jgi:2-keto-4-pentenoate hydratase/2-oxohepta-3-ene-1,7-dioic acid hydratase in catechol pathway
MKTLRYRIGNEVKPGILDSDENIHDASSLVSDWDNENVTIEKLNEIKSMDISSLPKVEKFDSIAPCVCKKSVGKIICIGLNYADHAEESGMKVPPEPIIFFKATSAIIGPNDDVIIPKNSQKSDWEVHIAGYCVVNDLSERAFQIERSGQWVKGKSCDTFGPIGPYLVTKDEIPDPQNLKLWLELNGKRVQDGSTATMVYGVNFLVSYLSQFMSLHPGDIISTGTPPGVGMGMNPQVFLKPGDVMELGVEGLGTQKQKTVAA